MHPLLKKIISLPKLHLIKNIKQAPESDKSWGKSVYKVISLTWAWLSLQI